MDWSGQVEYAKADWKHFEVDGEEAGLVTGYGPLQFLKVHFLIELHRHQSQM
jgi:serine carboxypeptidase-like clade 4